MTIKREGVLCRWCEYPLKPEQIDGGLCGTCIAWNEKQGGTHEAIVYAQRQQQQAEAAERAEYQKRKRRRGRAKKVA